MGMDDVIIARRDIEWAGPSIAVQACESLAQVDVLRALRDRDLGIGPPSAIGIEHRSEWARIDRIGGS